MNEKNLRSIVDEVDEALTYAGFDIVKTREKIINEIDAEDVIKMLVVHVKTGSSLDEKVQGKKVTDQEYAKELIKEMKKLKIFTRKKDLGSLTVARIALCFPMLLVEVRRQIKQKDEKIPTTTPFELQDLSFNGVVEVGHFAYADDFIKKFSFILEKVKKPDVTQEASDLKVMAFRKIAQAGRAADKVGNNVLMGPSGQQMIQLLQQYGYSMSVPPVVNLWNTKVQRQIAADLGVYTPELMKEIGFVELPPGTANKKKTDDENRKALLEVWISNGE